MMLLIFMYYEILFFFFLKKKLLHLFGLCLGILYVCKPDNSPLNSELFLHCVDSGD